MWHTTSPTQSTGTLHSLQEQCNICLFYHWNIFSWCIRTKYQISVRHSKSSKSFFTHVTSFWVAIISWLTLSAVLACSQLAFHSRSSLFNLRVLLSLMSLANKWENELLAHYRDDSEFRSTRSADGDHWVGQVGVGFLRWRLGIATNPCVRIQ